MGFLAPSETWSRSFCSDDILITNLLQEIWLYRCLKGISPFLLGSLTFLALYHSLLHSSRSLASSRCRLQLPLLCVLSSSWLEGSSLLCRGSQPSWFARCCGAICIRLAHIWAAPASSSTSIPSSPLSFTWVEPPPLPPPPLLSLSSLPATVSILSAGESLFCLCFLLSEWYKGGSDLSQDICFISCVSGRSIGESQWAPLCLSWREEKGSTNRSVVTRQMLHSSGAGFRSPPLTPCLTLSPPEVSWVNWGYMALWFCISEEQLMNNICWNWGITISVNSLRTPVSLPAEKESCPRILLWISFKECACIPYHGILTGIRSCSPVSFSIPPAESCLLLQRGVGDNHAPPFWDPILPVACLHATPGHRVHVWHRMGLKPW